MGKSGMHGLYAITPDMEDSSQLYAAVRHVLAGGARWLQYRNKTADNQLRLLQANMIRPLCKQFHVPLIINDHLDIALEIDADGLHVGQGDVSVEVARNHLGSSKIIGVSCYNRLDHAIKAERVGADYVAFGAFYPTMTKASGYQATFSLLDESREKLGIPVVAIGGIDLDNAEALIIHGCDAIAVSQALFGAQNIQSVAQSFSRLFN